MITYDWHETKPDTIVIRRDKRLTMEQKAIVRQLVGAAQSAVNPDFRKRFLRWHIRLAISAVKVDIAIADNGLAENVRPK